MQCFIRSSTGKSATKLLRAKGLVPAIIYTKDGNNMSISIESKLLINIIHNPSFMTQVISINVDNRDITAIPKDIQFHPITDLPYHIDFKEIHLDDIVKVDVPIAIINKEQSLGVKRGGQIQVMAYNVHIKCKVSDIPNQIMVDVAGSVSGDKYMLSNMELPTSAQIIKDCIVAKVVGGKMKK